MLNYQRSFTAPAIVAFTLLGWAWIALMSRDMYGSMTGLSAWMMTPTWDTRYLTLIWLMWAVMMGAMMLPSAMPLLLFYDSALRSRSPWQPVPVQVYVMAAGYLLTWAAFSVAATGLQRLLSELLVLNSMMEMSSRITIGSTLLLAGVYELTPWKRWCLRLCRTPLSFAIQRWRNGLAGALKMGMEHGFYCLGCCWALMLLLFAGGVMNLAVIVGLTAIVLIEKITPIGLHASSVVGVLMIFAGSWFIAG